MRMLKSSSTGVWAFQARRKLSFPFAFLLGLAHMQSQGQGALHITFDSPPSIQVGTARIVQQYYEAGMSFTPIDPDVPFAGFVRRKGGGTPPPDWPDNGSAYLQAGITDSLRFSFVDNSLFGISSVHLAGWNGENPDFVVHFVGYQPDGSTVATDFSGSGRNFQTFYFGPEFTSLTRVEIPTIAWSLDNLVVAIPEPSTWVLLVLGGVVAGCRFWRRRRRH